MRNRSTTSPIVNWVIALDGVREQVAVSRESGTISPKEAKWLEAIIDHADRDRWQKAMKAARRLMEDQVDR